jgi:hypothetical protein
MSIIRTRKTGFSYKYDNIFTCPGTGNLFPEKNKTSTGIRHCQLLKNQCCEKSTFPVCRVFILPGLLCLFPGTFRRCFLHGITSGDMGLYRTGRGTLDESRHRRTHPERICRLSRIRKIYCRISPQTQGSEAGVQKQYQQESQNRIFCPDKETHPDKRPDLS